MVPGGHHLTTRPMTTSRIDTFRAMVARAPDNALARFGLASEAAKAGLLEEARDNFRAYLAAHDDEGNAWGRLAEVLQALGDDDGAREALRRGIDASQRHGHPGMMAELEDKLEELG
jgi:thioredoxin-like negative regulator of GroEL